MNGRTCYIETLGCPKNRVDMEVYTGMILSRGGRVVSTPEQADIIILNTCAFLHSAREESVNRFFELCELQRDDTVKIVITGCLPQLYPDIAKQLPEADFIAGLDDVPRLASILETLPETAEHTISSEPDFITAVPDTRVVSLSPYTAYVKIADGCDNYCSYCSIPYIRGRYRERNVDEIIDEIRMLVSRGVREVILISQETTTYGRDGGVDLAGLCERTTAVEGDFRVRILYMYPSEITDRLLRTIVDTERIVPYIDMPLQHSDDKVLSHMNRRYTGDDIRRTLNRVNRICGDDVVLRTTFISGFPTETEAQHRSLVDFIHENQFDYIGVFPYSHEERTAAGKRWKPHGESVVTSRFSEVRAAAITVMEQRLERFVGQKETVLFEEIDPETSLCIGRGKNQAPEIDGVTYLTNVTDQRPGDMFSVRITGRDGVDFTAEIINEPR